MRDFFEDEIDEEIEEDFEEDDVLQCPSCFGHTAIIIDTEFNGELAVCRDCGFKWKELLEPNHLFVKQKTKGVMTVENSIENREMELENIGDDNIFDICDDDYERYETIIKFSDLRLQNHLPEVERKFIAKKQQNYFYKKSADKGEKEYKENRETLEKFISEPKSVSIKSVLYVLEHKCGLPGFKIKNDDYVNTEAVACKEFNINGLKGFGIDIDDLEKSLNVVGIKLIKFDNYKLFSEEEINILNGVTEQISTQEETPKEFCLSEEKTTEIKNILNDLDSITELTETKEINNEEKDFDEFLERKTTYGVTVEELYKEIKDCRPLGGFITSNPFIVDIDDYYNKYTQIYTSFPSLIDYDNKIVFIHISHKEVIDTLLENHFSSEYDSCDSFDERENIFHKKINCTQIFVNSRNRDNSNPLMLTNSNRGNILRDKFFSILKNNDIKFECLYTKSDDSDNELIEDYFVVLNKINDIVEGDVYFPKANEENIPEGKILVIPTATEEYFLPSLSSMNGNGCIITEKGSKTSHIVLMSKEFNFNIILIEKAGEKFKDGDNLIINLEDLIIYKK